MGEKGSLGKPGFAEAIFKEEVIFDQKLKGKIEFLYRMGKERAIQPEDRD